MEVSQCNRNPMFLADFAYDGIFSDGNRFCLRIPEEDVVEFANTLLKAYQDDMDGKVEVIPPHIHITNSGNIYHDGKIKNRYEQNTGIRS